MPRRMKAYLPRWIRNVMLPMLTLIWLFISYAALGTENGRKEIGVVGWAILTVLFAMIGVMFWMMTSGKLPAYEIELEDTPESGDGPPGSPPGDSADGR